ncbi:DUF58 domain-containing protein [Halalkalibacter krulwichiae]|uniref:DUF58 domain-containing protein n=1 Tax=Halalkalibacter krulwichiae TaxID=199441 RepID=UPI001C3F529A|nr:DUF58 domain-containing protein [Halalkalibacter krulwichiae]
MRRYSKYIFLVLFVLAVYSYAMFQGGFVSWFLFYSVITVIVATVAVAVFPFKVLKAERVVNKEVLRAGENVDVTVVIEKRMFQPFFFLRIQDSIPQKLGSSDEAGALFFFSFQRKLVFSYTIRDARRGEYNFEELRFTFGDLFGLFERQSQIPCQTTVLVYPRVKKLKSTLLSKSSKQMEGESLQQSFDDDRSLAGVRQYVPGDRLNTIDWKQSARSGHLMTKEFESYKGESTVVAFDSYLNKTTELAFERAVELAASMINSFIKENAVPKVSIRLEDWRSSQLSHRTASRGLHLLARVKPIAQPAYVIDKVYQSWQGMHVYYVCAELDSSFVQVCQTMLEQKIALTICMAQLTDEELEVARELEKLGISFFTIN